MEECLFDNSLNRLWKNIRPDTGTSLSNSHVPRSIFYNKKRNMVIIILIIGHKNILSSK